MSESSAAGCNIQDKSHSELYAKVNHETQPRSLRRLQQLLGSKRIFIIKGTTGAVAHHEASMSSFSAKVAGLLPRRARARPTALEGECAVTSKQVVNGTVGGGRALDAAVVAAGCCRVRFANIVDLE